MIQSSETLRRADVDSEFRLGNTTDPLQLADYNTAFKLALIS
jgi:hypothetical protein